MDGSSPMRLNLKINYYLFSNFFFIIISKWSETERFRYQANHVPCASCYTNAFNGKEIHFTYCYYYCSVMHTRGLFKIWQSQNGSIMQRNVQRITYHERWTTNNVHLFISWWNVIIETKDTISQWIIILKRMFLI